MPDSHHANPPSTHAWVREHCKAQDANEFHNHSPIRRLMWPVRTSYLPIPRPCTTKTAGGCHQVSKTTSQRLLGERIHCNSLHQCGAFDWQLHKPSRHGYRLLHAAWVAAIPAPTQMQSAWQPARDAAPHSTQNPTHLMSCWLVQRLFHNSVQHQNCINAACGC